MSDDTPVPELEVPLRRLLWAINHYVSTGDSVAEGVIHVLSNGRLLVLIPVNPYLGDDLRDFECFRSRFDELVAAYQTRLQRLPSATDFLMWGFEISVDQVDSLATELLERPGARGWGSMREDVAQYRQVRQRTDRRSSRPQE